MGFQKGATKPPNSGRKKGTLNKKRIPKVAEYLAERGLNPAEEILKLINETDEKLQLYPSAKVDAWFDLLSYCQGKAAADQSPTGGDEDQDLLDEFEDVDTAAILSVVKKAETEGA